MAVIPILPGIDERVVLVDPVTAFAIGTVGNPLFVTPTGAGAGGTSAVDHAPFTQNVSSFNPIGGVYNDGLNTMLSGEVGEARITHLRALHINPRAESGVELFPTPAALADTTANPTLSALQNFPMVSNGVTWDEVRDSTAATNGTKGVPAAGLMVFDTVDVQNKRVNSAASAIAGGVTGKNAAALAPLKYTVAHGSAPTNFAAGVFAAPIMTKAGVPFVAVGHPNNITQSINYTGAQTNTVVIANTAGTKLVVSSILVQASAANTVNIAVGVGLAQTVTPPSGTAGRLGGSAAVPPSGGFGRKTYQCGADGDQILVTSTGVGDFTCTVEYHVTTTA